MQGFIKGKSSAQVGISVLVSLADVAVANNTVAIIISGSIAKDISRQYNVDPRKTASLLDIFSCVWQGHHPYGGPAAAGGQPQRRYDQPRERHPYLWYQQLLAVFAIVSVFTPSRRICRRTPGTGSTTWQESGVAAKKAAMEVVK